MNQQERKFRFTQDWFESNWETFKEDGIEDAKGNVVKVSDALSDLSYREMNELDHAFSFGAHYFLDAVEIIAKEYLIEVVINELWGNHLASEEEAQKEIEWAKAELAFENHDMKESAR